MDLMLTAHFILATLPMLFCFLFALHDTAFRLPSQTVLPPFANRWTGYGGSWILLLLILYCCSWIIYTFGGCTGGLKHGPYCSLISNRIGNYAFFLMFFGFIYLVTAVLPAIVLFAGTDFAYRRRRKNFSAS